MIENNIPKLKFKNDYALLRFTFFLKKHEIAYEVNGNEVFISPDIDIMEPRFESGRSIYDSYKWYIETFRSKPFYKLRKRISGWIDAIKIPKSLLAILVIILVLSIGGRMAIDRFQDMSFMDKVNTTKTVLTAPKKVKDKVDEVQEYIPKSSEDVKDIVSSVKKLDEFKINIERVTPEPTKEEKVEKVIDVNNKSPGSFAIVMGIMLFLLMIIGGALVYLYKDELLSWRK